MKSGQGADSYHLLSDQVRLPADRCGVDPAGASVVTSGRQSRISSVASRPGGQMSPEPGVWALAVAKKCRRSMTAFVAVLVLTLTGHSAIAAVGPESGGYAASSGSDGYITGAHAVGLPRFSEITTGPRFRRANPAEIAQGGDKDAVVPPVKREQPAKPAVQPPPVQAPAPTAPQPSAKKPEATPPVQIGAKGAPFPQGGTGGGVVDAVQDWLARANREYQGVLMKQLSVPTIAGGDAIARKLEEQKAEDSKKADEGKKLADAKHLEDEKRKATEATQRLAEDERRKVEAAKKAEEARQAQASKQAQVAKPPESAKVPEPSKPAETAKPAEPAKKSEEPKKPEVVAKQDDAKAAEERRKAEVALKAREAEQLKEAERVAEDRRKQELQRQAEQKKSEDAQRAEDGRRKAEVGRRAEDDKRKVEAQAAEEKRRVQEAEAEKHRKRAITITPEPVVRAPAGPSAGAASTAPVVTIPDKSPKPTKDQRSAEGSAETGPVDDDGSSKSGSAKANSVSGGRSAHNRIRKWDWRPRRERHAACRAAGRLVTPPAHYVVRRGDSLWRISERHYHKGRFFRVIYRANRSRIADPDLIYPCQRFFLPLRK